MPSSPTSLPERTQNFFDEAQDLLERKNADYQSTEDAFAGFTEVAEALGLTFEQVWAVYYYKHVRAILNAAKGNALQDESLHSRLLDAANYPALLAAWQGEQRGSVDACDPFPDGDASSFQWRNMGLVLNDVRDAPPPVLLDEPADEVPSATEPPRFRGKFSRHPIDIVDVGMDELFGASVYVRYADDGPNGHVAGRTWPIPVNVFREEYEVVPANE